MGIGLTNSVRIGGSYRDFLARISGEDILESEDGSRHRGCDLSVHDVELLVGSVALECSLVMLGYGLKCC